ncbi:dTMP kinase [Streptomyces sp. NPDC048696]|uniref:dTMP kinase n=1 Tax=Streptomyces sp. NPDC048696 TaxID=3365585 RepID=UPI0037231060
MTGRRPGLFVAIDGPGGVGKSTTAAALARLLTAEYSPVHATAEPSRTPLGNLIRQGTTEYRGMTLARMIARDRRHHVAREIQPALTQGQLVLCDRFIASSLVLQRIDGIPLDTVWDLNRPVLRPDLTVLLGADPEVTAKRLANRGAHSRFELMEDSTRIEARLYEEAASFLRARGFLVMELDCTELTPKDVAARIADEVNDLRMGETHG